MNGSGENHIKSIYLNMAQIVSIVGVNMSSVIPTLQTIPSSFEASSKWPNRVLNPGEQPVANAAPLRPTLPETK